ncbi:hypothetical protein AMECASPLE_034604 [Ameca splendens]|uniref:Uncharacterized protein n=1 Tax=Ameca splendens TaxID=208324 RepID=A0ABV0Z5Z4_9TELE
MQRSAKDRGRCIQMGVKGPTGNTGTKEFGRTKGQRLGGAGTYLIDLTGKSTWRSVCVSVSPPFTSTWPVGHTLKRTDRMVSRITEYLHLRLASLSKLHVCVLNLCKSECGHATLAE